MVQNRPFLQDEWFQPCLPAVGSLDPSHSVCLVFVVLLRWAAEAARSMTKNTTKPFVDDHEAPCMQDRQKREL